MLVFTGKPFSVRTFHVTSVYFDVAKTLLTTTRKVSRAHMVGACVDRVAQRLNMIECTPCCVPSASLRNINGNRSQKKEKLSFLKCRKGSLFRFVTGASDELKRALGAKFGPRLAFCNTTTPGLFPSRTPFKSSQNRMPSQAQTARDGWFSAGGPESSAVPWLQLQRATQFLCEYPTCGAQTQH